MKLGELYERLGAMIASDAISPDAETVVVDTRSGVVDYLTGVVNTTLKPGDTEYGVDLPVGTPVVEFFIG
jgi:hypothetical protein